MFLQTVGLPEGIAKLVTGESQGLKSSCWTATFCKIGVTGLGAIGDQGGKSGRGLAYAWNEPSFFGGVPRCVAMQGFEFCHFI